MISLKRILPAVALALGLAVPASLATLGTATQAVAQATIQVSFVNRSGQSVVALQTSASSNPSWEADIFQGRVLRNGATFRLTIRNVVDCSYDVRALLANGAYSSGTFNICSNPVITIGR